MRNSSSSLVSLAVVAGCLLCVLAIVVPGSSAFGDYDMPKFRRGDGLGSFLSELKNEAANAGRLRFGKRSGEVNLRDWLYGNQVESDFPYRGEKRMPILRRTDASFYR